MDKVRVLIFWLLVPALALLFAVPILIVHVAVHVLIDRMRRNDREHEPAPILTTAAPRTEP
jgi:hypothetical protein